MKDNLRGKIQKKILSRVAVLTTGIFLFYIFENLTLKTIHRRCSDSTAELKEYRQSKNIKAKKKKNYFFGRSNSYSVSQLASLINLTMLFSCLLA